MNYAYNLLAKKYARAYLNVYGNRLSEQLITQLNTLHTFLTTHASVLMYVKLSSISSAVKLRGIQELCNRFALLATLDPLIALLAAHERLFLLALIVQYIHTEYRTKHNQEEFRVISAQPLPANEHVTIQQFLNQRIKKTIIATYHIDTGLIAGLRIISNNFLWEQSVAQQLRAIKSLL